MSNWPHTDLTIYAPGALDLHRFFKENGLPITPGEPENNFTKFPEALGAAPQTNLGTAGLILASDGSFITFKFRTPYGLDVQQIEAITKKSPYVTIVAYTTDLDFAHVQVFGGGMLIYQNKVTGLYESLFDDIPETSDL